MSAHRPADRAPASYRTEHRVLASDGWSLSIADLIPNTQPHAVVIAGHAMMVDRRTLLRDDRPCIAQALASAGHRVLVPDLRGHGTSGPSVAHGGSWTYGDLVDDVGCFIALAKRLEPRAPVVLLGHSLFGHVSLAYLRRKYDPAVKAMVLLAVDVWGSHDPSKPIRWTKHAVFSLSDRVARHYGYLPVRQLRLGSVDEPVSFWSSITAMERHGWPDELPFSAGDAFEKIDIPVLHVVSRRDRIYARPDSAFAFTRSLPRRETVYLGHEPRWRHLAPTHMGIVTDPNSAELWSALATWIRLRATNGG